MKLTMAPGDSESYYTSSLNFFIKKNNPHIIGSVVDILHSIQSVEYIVQEKCISILLTVCILETVSQSIFSFISINNLTLGLTLQTILTHLFLFTISSLP